MLLVAAACGPGAAKAPPPAEPPSELAVDRSCIEPDAGPPPPDCKVVARPSDCQVAGQPLGSMFMTRCSQGLTLEVFEGGAVRVELPRSAARVVCLSPGQVEELARLVRKTKTWDELERLMRRLVRGCAPG